MAKNLSSAVGIDIGSDTIKVAEVRVQAGQPTVAALGEAKTPPGAVDHTGVHDLDAVGAAIKELCASAGITVPETVLSLAGQNSVVVRTLEVAVKDDKELASHMEWEIQRNIPFAESTVTSDYQAYLPDGPASQNMDVVLAIAPESVAVGMRDMLKKAGRKAFAFDVEPLALARVVQTVYGSRFQGRTVCVVDMGHKTMSINIIRDGKLLMPRQVAIGGQMVTQAISSNMGLDEAQAEAVKRASAEVPTAAPTASYGAFAPAQDAGYAAYNPFADEASGEPAEPSEAPIAPAPATEMDPQALAVYNAMADVLEEVSSEIRRSVDYFRSQGGEVDQILLAGGGSAMKGLAESIESLIGAPAERLALFPSIPFAPRKEDQTALGERSQEFAVAVGNGLHIAY
jgi:type IV pilus assembly protein PilM